VLLSAPLIVSEAGLVSAEPNGTYLVMSYPDN